MNIFSCVNSENIHKIIVLFTSCYLNCDNEKKCNLRFFLLIDKPYVCNQIPLFLEEKLSIKVIDIDEKWLKLLNDFNDIFYKDCNWCKSDMNFSRFLFFKNFPNVDRVVYLDWDMIVKGDIYELIDYYNNLENMIVANVNNKSVYSSVFRKNLNSNILLQKNYHYINKKIISEIDCLNLDDLCKTKYFNSGFFIVSKSHFDEYKLINLITSLIKSQKKYNCFNFGTQVVQNLSNFNERIYVDISWNNTPKEFNDNINIIHWNGLDKPWNDENKNINKIWWNYKYYLDKLVQK